MKNNPLKICSPGTSNASHFKSVSVLNAFENIMLVSLFSSGITQYQQPDRAIIFRLERNLATIRNLKKKSYIRGSMTFQLKIIAINVMRLGSISDWLLVHKDVVSTYKTNNDEDKLYNLKTKTKTLIALHLLLNCIAGFCIFKLKNVLFFINETYTRPPLS